jgi:hypothetical protein
MGFLVIQINKVKKTIDTLTARVDQSNEIIIIIYVIASE